jgi:hypothetical protein
MPEKYHISTVATPGRFRRVGKFGSVDWREDCSRCTNCVKHRCLYEVYKHETGHNRDPLAAVQTHYECKACLSCVQGCTKGLLAIGVNPEFLDLGDDYWTPAIIATTWTQADTGRIPVSGAGYRGRFSGPGFDSIWTDMSEIVRPTRDGIHGREYISTTVDIGPKPLRLHFSPDGELVSAGEDTPEGLGRCATLIEIQLPVILDVPPWAMGASSDKALTLARVAAACKLHALAIVEPKHLAEIPADQLAGVAPLITTAKSLESCRDLLSRVRMIELVDSKEADGLIESARRINPAAVLAMRMNLTPGVADAILRYAAGPVKVFHLCADLHGNELSSPMPNAQSPMPSSRRHIKDALREVHGALVKAGRRDEITLIIGGGIALAEHMAKAIICGADLVAADTPLLVALGCRVCRDGHAAADSGGPGDCPAGLNANVDPAYATQRMVNLMGAWHSQLIEVLGAMGIREIRRLRGEAGRAIFMEEIEKEAFGDIVRK